MAVLCRCFSVCNDAPLPMFHSCVREEWERYLRCKVMETLIYSSISWSASRSQILVIWWDFKALSKCLSRGKYYCKTWNNIFIIMVPQEHLTAAVLSLSFLHFSLYWVERDSSGMGRRPCYYLTAVFYWLLLHNVLRAWRRTWKSQPVPVWRPKLFLIQRATAAHYSFSCGCKESIHCGGIIISHLAQVVFHSYFLTQKEGQDEQKCLTLVIIGVSVIFWRTFSWQMEAVLHALHHCDTLFWYLASISVWVSDLYSKCI